MFSSWSKSKIYCIGSNVSLISVHCFVQNSKLKKGVELPCRRVWSLDVWRLHPAVNEQTDEAKTLRASANQPHCQSYSPAEYFHCQDHVKNAVFFRCVSWRTSRFHSPLQHVGSNTFTAHWKLSVYRSCIWHNKWPKLHKTVRLPFIYRKWTLVFLKLHTK